MSLSFVNGFQRGFTLITSDENSGGGIEAIL
jgi:hypothetical protein